LAQAAGIVIFCREDDAMRWEECMSGSLTKVFAVVCSVAGAAAVASPATAQNAGSFYKGKTITILVGSSPGGGYDTYARMIARYLGSHIPGNPSVVVSNMPGAGSNVAANYIYNAGPKDGTMIGALYGGSPLEPLIGHTPVHHDPSKSQYLGSANNDKYICVARKDAPVQTFKDAFTKQLLVGAGVASSTSDFPAVLNAVLGTKFKLVLGYPGSREIALAVDKKEVFGACGLAWPAASVTNPGWFGPNGSMRVLVQTHVDGHPELNKEGIPNAMSFAKTEDQRLMLELFFSQEVFGRPYVLAPEVPKDRVALLRTAFMKTLADPALLADAKRANLEVDPIPGEEVQKLIAKAYAAPKPLVAKIKSALQTSY
jgi:tripartite-type tricarboxylate transporter receptor subunit TctC